MNIAEQKHNIGKLLKLRKTKEARFLIDQLKNLQPNDIELFYLHGICESFEGKFDLAEYDFLRVIQQKPEHHQALYALGDALERQGKYRQAQENYQKAASLGNKIAARKLSNISKKINQNPISNNQKHCLSIEKLRQLWDENCIGLMLSVRLHPQLIPPYITQKADDLFRHVYREKEKFEQWKKEDNRYRMMLMTIGRSACSPALNMPNMNEPDFNELMFYGAMSTIISYQDKPLPKELKVIEPEATKILTGLVNPLTVYSLIGTQISGGEILGPIFVQMLQTSPYLPKSALLAFKSLALMITVLSVPYNQIQKVLQDINYNAQKLQVLPSPEIGVEQRKLQRLLETL